MFVYGSSQRGVPMQVNVIGTAMFLIAISIVLGGELVRRRQQRGARCLQSWFCASLRTLRKICSISSKWLWSTMIGGDSWMTGSPRSSARQ